MQYESYRGKVKRVAAFLGKVYAYKPWILLSLLVLTVVISTMVATKGFIVMETDCPAEQVYGDRQGYRAHAILGRVTYEYCEQGSTHWTTEKPVIPGKYLVRAMCTSSSGKPRYGGTYAYTLLPREISPEVSDRRIVYGETPRVEVDLAEGDRISFSVRYESFDSATTRVWVDKGSISITDGEGRDRMACYVISDTPVSQLTFTRRPLQVTVQDSSKVYDDRRLSFDGYEVSGGSLATGDRLMAVFTASIIDAGVVENTPQLRVYRSTGTEVTHLYDMDVRSGTLTVEQRPLMIKTGSVNYTYSGAELDYPKYTLDPSTTLVSGHYLEVSDTTTLRDCGSVDNVLGFTVRNRAGANENRNYAFFVEAGTLQVSPRAVTVQTATGSLVYNGEYQSLQEASVKHGLGIGDELRVTEAESRRDVGSVQNRLTVSFYHGDKDVTSNYQISYMYGTLTILSRSVTVKIDDAQKIYDGEPLASSRYTVLKYPFGLVQGHTLTLQTKGSVIFGTSENRYVDGTAKVLDRNGNDVTANYALSIQSGTLTVNPRPLTVATFDDSKVYDGDPLSKSGFELKGGSLLPGHVLKIYTDGVQTDAGKSPNTVRKDLTEIRDQNNGNADVREYYSITYREGVLTVTPRPIVVGTDSSSWVYDGAYHSDNQLYLKEGSLVKDHVLLAEIGTESTIRDVGIVDNTVEATIVGGLESVPRNYTQNYRIVYEFGYLEIQPRPIVVRTADGVHVYDAQPYKALHCSLDPESPYRLVKGHILTVDEETAWGETNAGVYQNRQLVEIYDTNEGTYVTWNYELQYVYGTVMIRPRPLTAQILGEKTYDGLPLNEYRVNLLDGTSLCPGHTLTLQSSETITEVGEIYPWPDEATLRINDGTEDVLGNYEVTFAQGCLTVTPRIIDVQSADAEKTYDGLPLTAPYGVVTKDSVALVAGHRLVMAVSGSAVEPGQYANTWDPASLQIVDGDGTDVSHNYQVQSIAEGTLTVRHPVTVTVATESASKLYDGLPLTCGLYTVSVTDGVLPEGYTVQVVVTGILRGVGAVENTADVTVLDADGADVTDLVTLQEIWGLLTVYPETAEEGVAFGKVFADLTGILYLRVASYGDFDGQSWSMAPTYGSTLPQGYGYQYLAAVAAKNLQYKRFALQFADMVTFMMPYYTEPGGPAPVVGSDTDYGDYTDTEYIATYYYVGSGTDLVEAFYRLPREQRDKILGSYAIRERIYRAYVHQQYLSVDPVTAAYLQTIILQEGFSATDPDVIAKVATYIQHAAEYNLKYDHALDSADNVVIAFLRDYKEGICRHYATAATLLYRALGIPARYTTGFMQEVHAGEWVEIQTPGHAWVEVYIDGLGWVQVEVTGSDSTEEPPSVTERVELDLIPAFGYKEYDGTPLYAPEELVLTPALEALLEQGYTYSVLTAGAQQEIGISDSRIVSFTLYDPAGVDVTKQYDLIKHTGVLRVTAPCLEVFLYPMEKIYDGKGAVWGKEDYEILSIPAGLTLELEVCVTEADVGCVTLSDLARNFSDYVVWRIWENGEDVTSAYSLLFRMPEGMEELPILTVKPRPIQLTAASATIADRGEPLRNPEVYLSKGTLVAGHELMATAEGEQIGVGSSENVIRVENLDILDANGESVVKNYRITVVSGQLTIVKDG